MKAFIWERYGPPDWHGVRGKPVFSRATLGLLRPKHKILGGDLAGQVEAVGSNVTQFKPGDEIYANLLDHGYGGFAEYVSVPVEAMWFKPTNLSFEEAAAVPTAGGTLLGARGTRPRWRGRAPGCSPSAGGDTSGSA